ncbi:SgcJ/EcaC family oxidoreductase [Streptosporangium sp. NPDC002524]|uniref:SgcJ/EcaC family oxidoreductase n=1 Tax=Streptosporangium sp. NPDC002524 TaxID=3154537 RepID=UPI00332E7A59
MHRPIEAISAIPARMNEAWNRGDATAFFADFADDAEFADFEGTIYRGREQMIATHQPVFDTVMKGSRLLRGEVLFARTVGSGCGVVHHRVGIAMPGEKEPPPSRYSMQLFVVSRQNDRWEVVALQNSRRISLEAVMALESVDLQRPPG